LLSIPKYNCETIKSVLSFTIALAQIAILYL